MVTDPKGKLFAHSAEFLQHQGYRVRRIDFREPRLGLRFNPLVPVSQALHDSRDWTMASQAAWDIAHVLSGPAPGRGDPFWVQAQEALTAALILGIAEKAPEDAHYPLEGLADQPEAHFLIIPDDRSTRYPIVTLYLTQVTQALNQRAQQDGGRLARNVHFLLDEVGNLPPIPDLDKTITVAAGRGMRLTLLLQDLQQLKSQYRDAAGTILGNTATWVYLITQDWETASLLSKKRGEYTTEVKTFSHAHASLWRPVSLASGTAQESHALTGRPLLTPDERMRCPEGQSLVLQTRWPPARFPLPDLSAWNVFQAIAKPSVVESVPTPMEKVPLWWPGKEEDRLSEAPSAGLASVWRQSRDPGVPTETVVDW